ncbi:MAG: CDP-alcohol phosphatidyltransferase family protein [Deltaproteobacteria bacterium]|nr:CDP-alcohol phosphatidyltransferase family protein [Deltaproteobacteria bacterium]MBN2670587.1 CDP-alcohol phosphatidyltransferase family protein [Deltaproteobacteria bacterium]
MTQEQTAYVLCTKKGNPNRRIAGLTVGERLLLSLSYGGVDRVVFVGEGERPQSDRAEIEVVPAGSATLLPDDGVWLVPSDLVFDRGLLQNVDTLSSDLPLRYVPVSQLDTQLSDVEATVSALGVGEAESGKGFAIRVVDTQAAKIARKALFLSLIKPIDGFISKTINRKVSLSITRMLIHTPISPNGLTVAIMLLGILSGVAAYFAEHWWALVLAGVLFQTQSMLDGCDGEIARLKYQFSTRGQWLDSIGDDVTNYIFCLGLSFGQARVLGWDWLYGVGIAVFAIQWYASIVMYQRIYKMNTGDLLAIPNMFSSGEPKGKWGVAVRVIHTMTKRDFFVFVTSILAAVQLPLASFLLIAVGSLIMAPSLTLNEFRIRKAIRAGELNIPL